MSQAILIYLSDEAFWLMIYLKPGYLEVVGSYPASGTFLFKKNLIMALLHAHAIPDGKQGQ